MDTDKKVQTRKRFIGFGITAAALFTAFRFFVPGKKKPAKETVKMLTRDGTLVEVDVEKISCGKREKISDTQLKSWVKKQEDKL